VLATLYSMKYIDFKEGNMDVATAHAQLEKPAYSVGCGMAPYLRRRVNRAIKQGSKAANAAGRLGLPPLRASAWFLH
jgi:hypothetical protein